MTIDDKPMGHRDAARTALLDIIDRAQESLEMLRLPEQRSEEASPREVVLEDAVLGLMVAEARAAADRIHRRTFAIPYTKWGAEESAFLERYDTHTDVKIVNDALNELERLQRREGAPSKTSGGNGAMGLEPWEFDGGCTRCNATMQWKGDSPDCPEDAICVSCMEDELHDLRRRVAGAGLDSECPHVGSYVEILCGQNTGMRGFVRARIPGLDDHFDVWLGAKGVSYSSNEIRIVAPGKGSVSDV